MGVVYELCEPKGEDCKPVITPSRLLVFTAALLTAINFSMGWYYAFDFPDYLRSLFFSSLSSVRFAVNTVIVAIIGLGLSAGILAGRWSNEHRPVVWFIFISVFPLLIMSYGIIFESLGLNENNVFVEHPHRLTALYFSIVTWTTLGYGDVTPAGFGRVVVSIEVLTGYILSALLIAAVVTEFQRLSALTARKDFSGRQDS